MEKRGDKLHFGRSGGEVVIEGDLTFVETSLPGGSVLTGDSEPVQSEKYQSSLPAEKQYNTILTPRA